MRRLIVLVLLALTACSPAQERVWLRWFHRNPHAATEWAVNECGALCTDDWDRDGVVEPEPATDTESSNDSADEPDHPGEADDEHRSPSLGGRCSQWADEALAAGWSSSDWPTVDRIMYAESRCNPGAYNSQTHFGGNASGLMQIIWPTWAAECGWIDIFDPVANLACALYLKTTYGWSQWVTY